MLSQVLMFVSLRIFKRHKVVNVNRHFMFVYGAVNQGTGTLSKTLYTPDISQSICSQSVIEFKRSFYYLIQTY